jgi:pyruvate dehydrogenase E2 component (dihydrolipoamide acetyltransferase)
MGDTRAFQEKPLSAVQKVIAARMTQAKQTVPHFYLQTECAVDATLALLKRTNVERADVKLTVTDFIIRGAALALREVPLANSTWADNAIRLYEAVDIAVAVNTPFGLITPIVREADRKSVFDVSRELKDLAVRARKGRLKPEEYTGGTFTISNLGMYGVGSNFAIINTPQSCMLGVGAAEQRPVVRDGAITIGTQMTCTLSVDHRTIDGAIAAQLIGKFRQFLEQADALI